MQFYGKDIGLLPSQRKRGDVCFRPVELPDFFAGKPIDRRPTQWRAVGTESETPVPAWGDSSGLWYPSCLRGARIRRHCVTAAQADQGNRAQGE